MMNNLKKGRWGLAAAAATAFQLSAQEGVIPLTAADIFNRTTFNSVHPVLNTNGNSSWRYTGFIIWYWMVPPTVRSVSGNRFVQSGTGGAVLPAETLLWQLASIGGPPPPLPPGDTLPDYQSFSTADQNWYNPSAPSGNFNPGTVYFNFRITPDRFAANTFRAGEYLMDVTHNYTGGGTSNNVTFSPANFRLRLSVPAALAWSAEVPVRSFDIPSLDFYRSAAAQGVSLGNTVLAGTVRSNLWASASPQITFVSTKGTRATRNIGIISLSSADNRITPSPLASSWKNITPSGLDVEPGNRTSFELRLQAPAADLRRELFEAGTYTFRLSLQAKAADNSLAATQNADMTVRVPPLSEVKIAPASREVSFRFNTAGDYRQGQSQTLPGHLVVSNNENFELYVRAAAPNLDAGGAASAIPSSVFEVSVGGSPVPLSVTPQKLLSNAQPVLDKAFDITYSIPPAAAQQLVTKDKRQYTASVMYSFTAL